MFTTPTTIILGAGASYEFGAPLGESLWGQIVNTACAAPKRYAQFTEKNWAHSVSQVIQSFRFNDPKIYAYLNEIVSIFEGDPATLDEITKVRNSTQQYSRDLHGILTAIANRIVRENVHSSVDDFLRDNASLLRPLRVLIAAHVFEGLYERDGSNGRDWNLKSLLRTPRFNSPHDSKLMVDNWLLRFVGACRPMLLKNDAVTPVAVISFNYDLVMSTVVSEYWQRAERQFPAFAECFKFVYPYGRFGEFPTTVSDPGEWLRQQAQGIGLAGARESSEARQVRAAIADAQQIFSVGFSFTETNTNLLGLSEKHGKKLFVQNYGDRDTRLTRTLERFPGARSDPASIAQLVRDGFFEQQGPKPRTPPNRPLSKLGEELL